VWNERKFNLVGVIRKKKFKFCSHSPRELFYSQWRVMMNFWVLEEHSLWRIMNLAMASCP